MVGADTTYNNELIEIFSQAPNGAYTVQIVDLLDLIAPDSGAGLTNNQIFILF